MNNLKSRWQALSKWQKALANLLLSAVVIATVIAWQYNRMPGAALYVHNATDRPIFSYFVNGNWGGNAFAYGGGKSTCCWRIEGETLKVEWVLDVTPEQIEQGLEEETLTREISNPPRKRGDRYLHVHFFPGDQVRVAWSPNLDTPYENLKEAPTEPATKDQEARS